MSDVWNSLAGAFNDLNSPIGFAGSLITIYDHFKNHNKTHIQEILDAIREKSEVAYERYCQNKIYRKKDLGTPLKEDILGYWELCLRRDDLYRAMLNR